MSETTRIREAVRNVKRPTVDSRPNDYASSVAVTAVSAAAEYEAILSRCQRDVHRRLSGLAALFGDEVATPLFAAVEELQETGYKVIDMHQLALHEANAQTRMVGLVQNDIERQYWSVRSLLGDAVNDFDARRARIPKALRTAPPEWVVNARLKLTQAEPF